MNIQLAYVMLQNLYIINYHLKQKQFKQLYVLKKVWRALSNVLFYYWYRGEENKKKSFEASAISCEIFIISSSDPTFSSN